MGAKKFIIIKLSHNFVVESFSKKNSILISKDMSFSSKRLAIAS
jgi:hypothetical protein